MDLQQHKEHGRDLGVVSITFPNSHSDLQHLTVKSCEQREEPLANGVGQVLESNFVLYSAFGMKIHVAWEVYQATW